MGLGKGGYGEGHGKGWAGVGGWAQCTGHTIASGTRLMDLYGWNCGAGKRPGRRLRMRILSPEHRSIAWLVFAGAVLSACETTPTTVPRQPLPTVPAPR